MAKVGKVIELMNEYHDRREDIYQASKAGNEENRQKLVEKNRALFKKACSLLDEKDCAILSEGHNEIIANKIVGCFREDLAKYLSNSNDDKYMECIELQKAAVEKMIQERLILRVVIGEIDDTPTLICPVEYYYDGKCNKEVGVTIELAPPDSY